jgi:predicted N-formylglutamate amidohydrolase
MRPESVVVSCEHASNRVPAPYRRHGLPARRLSEHIAWDPGAALLARIVGRRLGAPCHLGRWSRLLVDLNRSLGHRKLMAAETFGIAVPGNRAISRDERDRRLARYYYPYRDAVTTDVLATLERTGACLHLSIHSFTPVVGGVVRRTDIGLLYDPARWREAALARRLRARLAPAGFRVRMNDPYRGTSDGFTTRLRRRLPARYVALEIETNQRLLATPAGARRIGRLLADALLACLRSE